MEKKHQSATCVRKEERECRVSGGKGAVAVDTEDAAFLMQAFIPEMIQREIQSVHLKAKLKNLQPDSLHNLCVCFLDAAHIPAEAVLVELFLRMDIPKAAGVG